MRPRRLSCRSPGRRWSSRADADPELARVRPAVEPCALHAPRIARCDVAVASSCSSAHPKMPLALPCSSTAPELQRRRPSRRAALRPHDARADVVELDAFRAATVAVGRRARASRRRTRRRAQPGLRPVARAPRRPRCAARAVAPASVAAPTSPPPPTRPPPAPPTGGATAAAPPPRLRPPRVAPPTPMPTPRRRRRRRRGARRPGRRAGGGRRARSPHTTRRCSRGRRRRAVARRRAAAPAAELGAHAARPAAAAAAIGGRWTSCSSAAARPARRRQEYFGLSFYLHVRSTPRTVRRRWRWWRGPGAGKEYWGEAASSGRRFLLPTSDRKPHLRVRARGGHSDAISGLVLTRRVVST